MDSNWPSINEEKPPETEMSQEWREECIRCGRVLLSNGPIPFTNIPHTDVYYCDSCLRGESDE